MSKSKSLKASAETPHDYPFIISDRPGVTKDPITRTLIRKQAMRDVGLARRRRRKYGRANLDQSVTAGEDTDGSIEAAVPDVHTHSLVISSSTCADPPDTNQTSGTRSTESTTLSSAEKDPPKRVFESFKEVSDALPLTLTRLTGYERIRSEFHIDLTQFSMLTSFLINKSAIPFLSTHRSCLATLMEVRQWSYLEFIPQRYDRNQCLAAVTDCVLAKLSSVLIPHGPTNNQRNQLKLYSRALCLLQDAISDPVASTLPETLCAIQLLSLYELLDPTRGVAWSHHIMGSALLVKYRGPHRFESEFEKALLAGHVGPIISEALLTNMPCYLEEPQWTDLYSSLLQETSALTERSALSIHGRKLMFPLPRLWHDIRAAVLGSGIFDDHLLRSLEERGRQLQSDCLNWLEEYKAHCVASSLSCPSPAELALRRELFGGALECLIVIKRLLSTVCESDRIPLETETQALALLLLDLQKQPFSQYAWLFCGNEVETSYSTIDSKSSWEQDLSGQSRLEQKLATRERFLLWDAALRGQL